MKHIWAALLSNKLSSALSVMLAVNIAYAVMLETRIDDLDSELFSVRQSTLAAVSREIGDASHSTKKQLTEIEYLVFAANRRLDDVEDTQSQLYVVQDTVSGIQSRFYDVESRLYGVEGRVREIQLRLLR